MKILIVDDDPSSIELLRGFLLPYGECDNAASGKEALDRFDRALAENSPYNLVSLDISMPEMDGHVVLSEVRKIEDAQGLSRSEKARVIMVSAASVKGNLVKAFKGQCDAFLPKPVSKNDVLRQLYLLDLVSADAIVKDLLDI